MEAWLVLSATTFEDGGRPSLRGRGGGPDNEGQYRQDKGQRGETGRNGGARRGAQRGGKLTQTSSTRSKRQLSKVKLSGLCITKRQCPIDCVLCITKRQCAID